MLRVLFIDKNPHRPRVIDPFLFDFIIYVVSTGGPRTLTFYDRQYSYDEVS
jgi:hypothetical protein